MFGLFKKRKKDISQLPISEALPELYNNHGAKYLNIMLWIGDQILFQVIPAKHFIDKGIKSNSDKDLVVLHFFNKNKTNTIDTWEYFKNNSDGYINFENPKGNENFIKLLGNNPKQIERLVNEEVIKYKIKDQSLVKIQYSGEN